MTLDFDWMNAENFVAIAELESVSVYVAEGITDAGTFSVIDTDLVPISVLPEYVSQYSVPTAAVAFGTWLASVNAGVQLTEVFAVFVMIVPESEPTWYRSVWVNVEDAGLSVMVEAVPIVRVPTEGVVDLGIVGSEIVADPVMTPIDVEKEQSPDHASVTLFVPSALCDTVHSP